MSFVIYFTKAMFVYSMISVFIVQLKILLKTDVKIFVSNQLFGYPKKTNC